MCRELLERRVSGLSIFSEHVLLLLLLPLLLRLAWRVPWGSLLGHRTRAALDAPRTRNVLTVLGRALMGLGFVCILERLILALASDMPTSPRVVALGGAGLVLGSVQAVVAIKWPCSPAK